MDLGERIKYLRTSQGMTLEEVGNAVGVGKSTVRKWESGQIANMRRDKIALVAKALHVTPSYLMGWDEITDSLGSDSPAAKKLREIGGQLAPSDKLREIGEALAPSETELVTIYRGLNATGQLALLGTARGLMANPDMVKDKQ